MSNTAKWYVVQTYSGYENKVAKTIDTVIQTQNLQELIEKTMIPVEKIIEKSGAKEKEIERKIYPGYVMVKMNLTDDSWHVIRSIRGVTGFIGSADKPVPLTQREVDAMGVETVKIEVNYQVGDSVRVVAGPLESYVGVVDKIDEENDVVTIIISMLGRDTPTELALNQVRKAD